MTCSESAARVKLRCRAAASNTTRALSGGSRVAIGRTLGRPHSAVSQTITDGVARRFRDGRLLLQGVDCDEDRRCACDRHLPGQEFRDAQDRDRRRSSRHRRRDPERTRARGRRLPARACRAVPAGPRRTPDRGHLAVPVSRCVLAPRARDHGGYRRGGHGALGPQGQGGRHAVVPAARRAQPHRRARLRSCQRPRHRRDRRRGRALHRARLSGDPRAIWRAGARLHLRGVGRQDVLRARRREPAERERLVDGEIPRLTSRSCSMRCARGSARDHTCCTTSTTG